MYARAVDDAAERLRALRQEECGDLALAGLALALAVAVTQVHPPLAVPLFLGGIAVGALGLRALWRRWDLVERLAGDRDAHTIPEVLAYAARETTMERRRTFAALVRRELPQPGCIADPRIAAVAGELEALARELEDDALGLDPVAAVACMRLLSNVAASPLFNPSIPAEELRSRIRQIRSGVTPRARVEAVPGRPALS
jgi:hypothetical protein